MKQDANHSAEQEASARLLGALLDGELSEAARDVTEARVRENPDDAARLAHYQAQNQALHALFPLPAPAPALLLQRRPSWRQRAWIGVGGMAAGLLLGFGLFASDWTGLGEPAFARRADMAYAVYAPEARHPVEVAASDQAHLVSWLSRRLGRPLTVPSFAEYGYTLVGGRLLPGDAGPAAQFMYQSGSGERLTLYVTVFDHRDVNPQSLQGEGRRTFYWADHGMGYALSGPGEERALSEIAQDACYALGGRPDSWKEEVKS
ncbi:anti-sigma factor [Paludibacterium sp.]|uniref:anti-sigma factor family protein n=1 Tax=Paludibacterium sp. TaxID=1917523 RepID=UPI0025EEE066|nr:anti-sigma factor [Paludibacterium sp.]MBV8646987.1 anti-sigma factor [Paludibacterium sp.]